MSPLCQGLAAGKKEEAVELRRSYRNGEWEMRELGGFGKEEWKKGVCEW
jgi:hypothetical protein